MADEGVSMPTFGRRLRRERESRNITLHEISESTKIVMPYLEALEHDDFARLPGGVFNKGYVRAYAQCIGLDPEPLVEAFLHAQRSPPPEVSEHDSDLSRGFPTSVPTAPSARDRSIGRRLAPRRRVWLVVPFAVIVVVIAGWLSFRAGPPALRPETQVSTPASAPLPPSAPSGAPLPAPAEPVRESSARPSAVQSERTIGIEDTASQSAVPPPLAELGEQGPTLPEHIPTSAAQEEEPSAVDELVDTVQSGDPSIAVESGQRLAIAEFGVGRRVVDHRLEAPGQRFEEGSRVSFWTRVVGGVAGEHLRHVWLREGRVVDSIELVLGGPHWRTHSRKTLYPGSVGQWAVEARDSTGRVLAKTEFTCVEKRSGSDMSED